MKETQEKSMLEVHLNTARRVNFASAQNDIPVIKSLILFNHGSEPISDLSISLRIDPPVISPKYWSIDRLTPGELKLNNLDTPLDIERLRGLNEAEKATLLISITKNGATLIQERQRIELLAKDEWGGLQQDMDQLIASFVSPNDPAIAEILKTASSILHKEGHRHSLEGYQSEDPERAWMIAASIWSAVTGMGLTYTNPPASFEREGQKIRGPMQIRTQGLATCLDTALLFAGAWEAAGLNSAVLFSKGHAFAGFWIVPKDFGLVTEPDAVAIRKAIQAKEFYCVETTLVTQRPAENFEAALREGRAHLSEQNEDKFEVAVDLPRARSAKIKPLASHQPEEETGNGQMDVTPAQLPKPSDLGFLPEDSFEPMQGPSKGRIERWQSKLLDLSLRNRLLNFRKTKQAVPCMVPDTGKLEDALADGKSFKAFSLFENHPIGERRVTQEEEKQIIDSAVQHAYENNQISVLLDKNEMDKRLVSIHRKAKSDLQEGGTNTLYLAAGFLRWQKEGDTKKYRAPLLLIPIKLSRRSVRSPFKIKIFEDEVRFNLTLLEFLKQDFGLLLPELEGELPRDDSGIDVPGILNHLRSKVRDIRGFEVIEEIEISTFSFAKYLMWKDMVDRTDQLRNNRLVAHLIDDSGAVFNDKRNQKLTPADLDTRVAPEEIFTPLLADSSQLSAILDAVDDRDFVLIGPPGTGKSQTIANIICQCLAHGKTILFVAEKSAALDVVHRRLKSYGLSDAILELHSNKTDRKRVLNQLERNWDRTANPHNKHWRSANEKISSVRGQLNTYTSELHKKGTQGFSAFDAIGWIAQAKDGLHLDFGNKDCHDEEGFHLLEETVKTLGQTFSIVSDRPQLSIINASEWSNAWQKEILESARVLLTNLQKQIRIAENLSDLIGLIPDPDVTSERRSLLSALAKRVESDAENLSLVPDLPYAQLQESVTKLGADLNEINKQKQLLNAEFPEEQINRMPLDQIDVDWRSANADFWPRSAFAKRKVRRFMQTYAKNGIASPETDLPILIVIKNRLTSFNDNPSQPLSGETRSIEQATRMIEQARLFREALSDIQPFVSNPTLFNSIISELEGIPNGSFRRVLEEWTAVTSATNVSYQEFIDLGRVDADDVTCSKMISDINVLLSNRSHIRDWTKWCKVRKGAKENGLGRFTKAMESNEFDSDDLVLEFKRAYARWWLPLVLDSSSELREFTYWEHEKNIENFRDLDDQIARLVSPVIMRRIQHDLPKKDVVSRSRSELGALKHQLGLKRPSKAIRPLLEELGEAFPKLAPCVLMSPLSIAQYLPADQSNFDVVIFDEASQITTWDAIGAIARGKQSIIVGDPKQLPPTNFFGRTQDEDEDEHISDFLMGDMPSILDEVKAAGIPVHHLNWHYRSRDEALISFSNHHYYDGTLVTFPAPSTDSNALKFHKINGIYDRGRGRTNLVEAHAIAEMIRIRLNESLNHPEEKRLTFGVITFNSQQQTLILDLLEAMRHNNPKFEWFFSDKREEPVIVKNLENIQGDERDVILFSITFGPDDQGKLTMGFGALNVDGGEKRLNVAVTRARQELHVFSTINPQQIDLSRTRATGVRDLKNFLRYAENGGSLDHLSTLNNSTLESLDNPFENAVADALRAKGWEVRTQIGNSDFRVDIGIVHPDHPDSYLSGIECDGSSYHKAATARDRDRIRQSVMENLGWDLYRIWSIDWYLDSESVINRIHNQLEKRLEADREIQIPEARQINGSESDATPSNSLQNHGNKHIESTHSVDDSKTRIVESSPQSVKAQNSSILDPERFFETSYLPILEQLVVDIVSRKGPMPLKRLRREVSTSHGWKRTGSRIEAQIQKAMRGIEIQTEFGESFVWIAGDTRNQIPFQGLNGRPIREVSRKEIASVLDAISENLWYADDPVHYLSGKLGIGRLSNQSRAYLEKIIDWHLGR